jgi:hypothetical protein
MPKIVHEYGKVLERSPGIIYPRPFDPDHFLTMKMASVGQLISPSALVIS